MQGAGPWRWAAFTYRDYDAYCTTECGVVQNWQYKSLVDFFKSQMYFQNPKKHMMGGWIITSGPSGRLRIFWFRLG